MKTEGSKPKEEVTRFATDSEIIQYLRKQLQIQNIKHKGVEDLLRDQLEEKEAYINRIKVSVQQDNDSYEKEIKELREALIFTVNNMDSWRISGAITASERESIEYDKARKLIEPQPKTKE